MPRTESRGIRLSEALPFLTTKGRAPTPTISGGAVVCSAHTGETMKRSQSLYSRHTPALTPDAFKPLQDAVHQALAMQNLELKREIAGRDRRIASLEGSIRELRKAAMLPKLTVGPKQ